MKFDFSYDLLFKFLTTLVGLWLGYLGKKTYETVNSNYAAMKAMVDSYKKELKEANEKLLLSQVKNVALTAVAPPAVVTAATAIAPAAVPAVPVVPVVAVPPVAP